MAAGAVVQFYVDQAKAQKACDEINSGSVDGWTDAVVVKATPVTVEAAS